LIAGNPTEEEPMMDEFSVLLDEHRAMHACANQLREVAGQGRDHEEIAALLRPLAWMASCVHAPKENAALLERLVGEALANAGVARLMEDRSRVEENLRDLSRRWDSHEIEERTHGSELVSTVMTFKRVMDAEERLLYPAVYMRCTDDDLWAIGVALDRRIDSDGRPARAAFLRRHTDRFQVV
jgi:hemerythrin-like domain-containing protein